MVVGEEHCGMCEEWSMREFLLGSGPVLFLVLWYMTCL